MNFPSKESNLCEWCYMWNECSTRVGNNPSINFFQFGKHTNLPYLFLYIKYLVKICFVLAYNSFISICYKKKVRPVGHGHENRMLYFCKL